MSKTKQNKNKTESKSDVMRKMWSEGVSISDIAKQTHSHYSFVYETVKKFARKQNVEFTTNQPQKERRADKFREDYQAGMSIGEIAKKHNANYSYVWTVIDKLRNEQ